MNARMLRTLAPVLLAGLLLAGCGDDDPSPDPPASVAPTVGAGPATALPPAATTPVPPPTPGSTQETEAPRPVTTKKPVPLGAAAKPGLGLSVRVADLDAINAKAQGPGEVAGPALAVKIEVRNGGKSDVDLSDAAVSLTASDDSPGEIMSGPPTAPLPTAVAAGRTVDGVYTFAVPSSKRSSVRVDVTVGADLDIVAFRGRAPR